MGSCSGQTDCEGSTRLSFHCGTVCLAPLVDALLEEPSPESLDGGHGSGLLSHEVASAAKLQAIFDADRSIPPLLTTGSSRQLSSHHAFVVRYNASEGCRLMPTMAARRNSQRLSRAECYRRGETKRKRARGRWPLANRRAALLRLCWPAGAPQVERHVASHRWACNPPPWRTPAHDDRGVACVAAAESHPMGAQQRRRAARSGEAPSRRATTRPRLPLMES